MGKIISVFTRPLIRLLQVIVTGAAGAVHETAAPAAGVLADCHAVPDETVENGYYSVRHKPPCYIFSLFHCETKAVRDVPVLFRSAPDCGAFFIFRASFPANLSSLQRVADFSESIML